MQDEIENINKERYSDVKIVSHQDAKIEAALKTIDNMSILKNLAYIPNDQMLRQSPVRGDYQDYGYGSPRRNSVGHVMNSQYFQPSPRDSAAWRAYADWHEQPYKEMAGYKIVEEADKTASREHKQILIYVQETPRQTRNSFIGHSHD